MMEILGLSALTIVVVILLLVVGGVTALAYLMTKEEKFEDVVEAQRREQEDLLHSLSTSQSSKTRKRNTKQKPKVKGPEVQSITAVAKKPCLVETVVIDEAQIQVSCAPELQALPKESKPAPNHGDDKALESQKKKAAASSKKPAQKVTKAPVVEEVLSVSAQENVVEAAPPSTFVEKKVEPVKQTKLQSTKASPIVQPSQRNTDEANESGKKAAQNAKSKKKSRKDTSSNFNLDAILEAIQIDHLGKSELQIVTETLLAKQAGLEDWKSGNQKGDTAETHKRQLQQLNEDLERERTNSQAGLAKVKDLRQELEQMKAHHKVELAKSNAKISEEAKEINNLRRKLDEQTKARNAGMTDANLQRNQHAVDCSPAELMQLREESMQFKKVSKVAQQLADDKNSLFKECQQLQANNKQLRGDVDSLRAGTDAVHQMYKEKLVSYDRELAMCKAEYEGLCNKQSVDANKQKTEESIAQLGENLRLLSIELENHKRENSRLKSDAEKEHIFREGAQRQLESLNQEKMALSSKVDQFNAIDSKRQSEIKDLLSKIEKLKASSNTGIQTETTVNGDVVNQMKEELQQTQMTCKEKAEELEKVKEKDEEVKKELKHYKEVVENLKLKNNELREKNWKAMDAVDKAEKASEENAKICKRKLIKCMKVVQPDYKADGQADLEGLLDQFQNNCASLADNENQKVQELKTENIALKSTVDDLQSKVKESDISLANVQSELTSATIEKDHCESILHSTESMLKDLQSSVEVEIAKWQGEVSRLEEELKQAKDGKSSSSALESVKKELDKEVSTRRELATKLEKVNGANKQLSTEKAQLESKLSSAEKLANSKSAELLKALETNSSVEKKLDDLKKKAKEGGIVTSPVKGDNDKDKIIAKLKIENADLLEQLRDERDQIVVDVAPAVGEGAVQELKDQLQAVAKQLNEAEASKSDLQKTSAEMTARLNEIAKQNEKLHQTVQEHESARSKEIEKAINDAITQLNAKLNEREKQLDDEKQTTTQLRLQVAALQQGMKQEGTSV